MDFECHRYCDWSQHIGVHEIRNLPHVCECVSCAGTGKLTCLPSFSSSARELARTRHPRGGLLRVTQMRGLVTVSMWLVTLAARDNAQLRWSGNFHGDATSLLVVHNALHGRPRRASQAALCASSCAAERSPDCCVALVSCGTSRGLRGQCMPLTQLWSHRSAVRPVIKQRCSIPSLALHA